MTAPVLFDYAGQTVRTTFIDGDVWFVATDVCRILQHSHTPVAMQMLDDDEKRVLDSRGTDIPNVNPVNPDIWLVSEAGVYELAFRSTARGAKSFKRWITHEVLPQIRRTGSFGRQAALPTKVELAQMVIEAETARELAEAKVAELEPKAELADRLLDADGDLCVADAAKALTRAGLKLGAGRLFTVLSDRAWIYRAGGDQRWHVYQTAIESGVMSVLPQSHYHPRTGVLVLDPPQPRVTPKGLQKLLTDLGALVPV